MSVISAARRLCLSLLVAATPIGAQAPRAIPVNVTALGRLDFLLGEWEGDGWILLGRGERRTFHQRETVRSAAGGTVVVIDGLGTSTDAGREGETVHQAFAVVTYDSATAKLRWRAYRATGEETVAEPMVERDTLVWGMELGPGGRGGRIRFTIRRTATGEWNEIGEMIAPGANGRITKFFEMTLKRR